MKKILLILSFSFLGIFLFMVFDTWETIQQKPNIEFGHILLTDRTGKIVTDKWRIGGYSMNYTGSLDAPLIKSIMAIEDARFYEHNGINIRAKIGSIYQNIQAGEVVRGGSTITEQYIKNAFYNREKRTILQKLRESLAAIIIEKQYSKDEILRRYLSLVYMWNWLYGISTMQLGSKTDGDAILDIVTRLKFPNITEKNRSAVDEYRKFVSSKLNIIPTRDIRETTTKNPQIDLFPLVTERIDTEISNYCKNTKNNLDQWTLQIPENICTSPDISIELTIDADIMSKILSTSRWVISSLIWKNVNNAAIYIIDPKTRKILVYIGNTNAGEKIDMIDRSRSVGSLLKPFVYLLALRSGVDAEDYVLDEKTAYETGVDGKYFIPENYNPKSYGPVKIREALGNSLNSSAVRITDILGINTVYNWLKNFWVILNQDASYYGYGISLGTVETSLENIVESYRIFSKTEDPDIWQINNILSDSRNRARTFGGSSILNTSIPMSVKTGTSTDFRDNWTIGYNSDIIVGIWVWNTDGSSMWDISGVSWAGPIWHSIAELLIEKWIIKNTKTPPPKSLKQISICLDIDCNRKELSYTKKSSSPQTRPIDSVYFSSDFYGNLTSEEKEKWNIEN
jgi:penicillin-binding protein 1C